MIYKANDDYQATLRTTWIYSPADTSLGVTAIPSNLPTIITVGYGTDVETKFSVTGTSGDSSSNYSLTGVTILSGGTQNIPEQTACNCLNNEDFFNQYLQTIDWIDDDDATTIDLDVAESTRHRFTIAGNRTLTVSNASSGQGFVVRIKQDATGSRTITWFDGISWAYGTTPTLTTTASKADLFVFICTNSVGSPTFDGFVVGQNL